MATSIPPKTKRRPTDRRAANDRRAAGLGVDAPVAVVPRHEVERRAYERFIDRGGVHGDDVNDWLEAERELQASRAIES